MQIVKKLDLTKCEPFGEGMFFRESDHSYWGTVPEGYARKKSVTSILGIIDKPALRHWEKETAIDYIGRHLDELKDSLLPGNTNKIFDKAREEAALLRETAASIGTSVHLAIENFFHGILTDPQNLTVEGQKAYGLFLKWFEENTFSPQHAELCFFNKEHDFCGMIDAIGELKGERVLIDWKTGSGIYAEAILQVGAYFASAPEKCTSAQILRLGKDGVFQTKHLTEMDCKRAMGVFIAVKKVSDWKDEMEKELKG